MDTFFGGWLFVGGALLWAGLVTYLCIAHSMRVKALVAELEKNGFVGEQAAPSGITGHRAWPVLRQAVSGLIAECAARKGQLEEQAVSMQNMKDEFILQKECDVLLLQDARDTGNRIMVGASTTMEKSIASTRAIINTLDLLIGNAGNGATEQQSKVQDTASTLEEINASIGQMNTNADQASMAAGQAREEADRGARLVGDTRDRIDEVNQETRQLETVLGRLGERTHEIGAVIDLISDIADQTNLLALNAAIEAAIAGESGRGFAVVADEVRNLAEKTMAATREVNEKISGIQTGVAETASSTGRTTSLVNTARDLAEQSNHVLEHLAELSSRSQQQVESIATAVNQQAVASEDITRTMSHVDGVSRKTAEEMHSAADAMGGLVVQAEEMSNLLNVFKLLGEGALQKVMRDIVSSSVIISGSREAKEAYLREIVAEHTWFELLYLTDAQGVQIISNIPKASMQSPRDAQAFEKDWSQRLWFVGAMNARGLVVSDVYESVATGEKCVTVSSTVMDGSRVVGVIAADVILG